MAKTKRYQEWYAKTIEKFTKFRDHFQAQVDIIKEEIETAEDDFSMYNRSNSEMLSKISQEMQDEIDGQINENLNNLSLTMNSN